MPKTIETGRRYWVVFEKMNNNRYHPLQVGTTRKSAILKYKLSAGEDWADLQRRGWVCCVPVYTEKEK